MKQIDIPFALTMLDAPAGGFNETRADALSAPRVFSNTVSPAVHSAIAAQFAFARCVRQFLDREGHGHWRLYHANRWEFDDEMFASIQLAFPDKRWCRPDPVSPVWMYDTLETPRTLSKGMTPWHMESYGLLHIPEFEVLIARCTILDASNDPIPMVLLGSPGLESIQRFQSRIVRSAWRQGRQHRAWNVIYKSNHRETGTLIDSGPGFDSLEISDSLLNLLHRDLVGFFRHDVHQLHRDLGIPYVRRALLYGPPGTGKTSICRAIVKACAGVAAFHLMPGSNFDDEDLKSTFDAFAAQAPAVLLIEDLDTLVGNNGIKVSNILNLLDGANSSQGDGLLILATTNFPENLPQSLANRPGRFVPIEVPLPDAQLRHRFAARVFRDSTQEMIASIVSRTQGLSFAHLQEILLVSGLVALKEGRTLRTPGDIDTALQHVVANHNDADAGFLPKPKGRFGFSVSKE